METTLSINEYKLVCFECGKDKELVSIPIKRDERIMGMIFACFNCFEKVKGKNIIIEVT